MRLILKCVVCCLCLGMILASEETYKAAVISGINSYDDFQRYLPLINDAAQAKAEVVVLSSPRVFSSGSDIEVSCALDNYDELVTMLSGASKKAGVYLVAHLLEKTKCQNKNVLIRSNLVFDREGDVVSVYRKPLNNVANCTAAVKTIATFETDFGVTFGVLMEEDLILQEEQDLKGLKNFVVTGDWATEIPFLSASQFGSSWAFVNKANLVTSSGIFSGRAGAKTDDGNLLLADLKKSIGEGQTLAPPVVTADAKTGSTEDLSLYVIRPLDLEASIKGYKESVCHGDFCCDFFVKSKFVGPKREEINYGLAVFNGARSYSRTHTIGAQTCALLTCAGLYKRSCSIGIYDNNMNVGFDKISISGNFTLGNVQYPIILTAGSGINSKQFIFKTSSLNKVNIVTLASDNVRDVLHFGIFGRDYSMDSVSVPGETSDIYSYIFNEDMQEFFDYVWIRLRILIFIVSIYVLEML